MPPKKKRQQVKKKKSKKNQKKQKTNNQRTPKKKKTGEQKNIQRYNPRGTNLSSLELFNPIDSPLSPEASVIFKKLRKKDVTTLLKGVEELGQLIEKSEVKELELLIPHFVRMFLNLGRESRENKLLVSLLNNLGLLVSKVQKKILPFLQRFFGSWYCYQRSISSEISKAAQRSLNLSFPTEEKLTKAIQFCENEIIAHIFSSLAATPLTVAGSRKVSLEHRKEIVLNLRTSSLGGAALLIENLGEQCKLLQENNDSKKLIELSIYFSNDKQDKMVIRRSLQFLQIIFQKKKNLYQNENPLLNQLIDTSLFVFQSKIEIRMRLAFLLSFLKNDTQKVIWDNFDSQELFYNQCPAFFKNSIKKNNINLFNNKKKSGSSGPPIDFEDICSCLVPLLNLIPKKKLKWENKIGLIVDSFWEIGRNSKRVMNFNRTKSIFFSTFSNLMHFLNNSHFQNETLAWIKNSIKQILKLPFNNDSITFIKILGENSLLFSKIKENENEKEKEIEKEIEIEIEIEKENEKENENENENENEKEKEKEKENTNEIYWDWCLKLVNKLENNSQNENYINLIIEFICSISKSKEIEKLEKLISILFNFLKTKIENMKIDFFSKKVSNILKLISPLLIFEKNKIFNPTIIGNYFNKIIKTNNVNEIQYFLENCTNIQIDCSDQSMIEDHLKTYFSNLYDKIFLIQNNQKKKNIQKKKLLSINNNKNEIKLIHKITKEIKEKNKGIEIEQSESIEESSEKSELESGSELKNEIEKESESDEDESENESGNEEQEQEQEQEEEDEQEQEQEDEDEETLLLKSIDYFENFIKMKILSNETVLNIYNFLLLKLESKPLFLLYRCMFLEKYAKETKLYELQQNTINLIFDNCKFYGESETWAISSPEKNWLFITNKYKKYFDYESTLENVLKNKIKINLISKYILHLIKDLELDFNQIQRLFILILNSNLLVKYQNLLIIEDLLIELKLTNEKFSLNLEIIFLILENIIKLIPQKDLYLYTLTPKLYKLGALLKQRVFPFLNENPLILEQLLEKLFTLILKNDKNNNKNKNNNQEEEKGKEAQDKTKHWLCIVSILFKSITIKQFNIEQFLNDFDLDNENCRLLIYSLFLAINLGNLILSQNDEIIEQFSQEYLGKILTILYDNDVSEKRLKIYLDCLQLLLVSPIKTNFDQDILNICNNWKSNFPQNSQLLSLMVQIKNKNNKDDEHKDIQCSLEYILNNWQEKNSDWTNLFYQVLNIIHTDRKIKNNNDFKLIKYQKQLLKIYFKIAEKKEIFPVSLKLLSNLISKIDLTFLINDINQYFEKIINLLSYSQSKSIQFCSYLLLKYYYNYYNEMNNKDKNQNTNKNDEDNDNDNDNNSDDDSITDFNNKISNVLKQKIVSNLKNSKKLNFEILLYWGLFLNSLKNLEEKPKLIKFFKTEISNKFFTQLFRTIDHYQQPQTIPPTTIENFNNWDLGKYSSYIFYETVSQLPTLIRFWGKDKKSKSEKIKINNYFENILSPILLHQEFTQVIALQEVLETRIRIDQSFGHIQLIIQKESFSIDMLMKVPKEYPLKLVEFHSNKVIGFDRSSYRKLFLQMVKLLSQEDSNLASIVSFWTKNVNSHFEGVDPCSICLCVINLSDSSLPRISCPQCKEKFHAICLHKWFASTVKSVPDCPLCRGVFNLKKRYH
ncbi:e3 ubiquitin-protein ligase listerin [Anaeramoeba flamelloides]|uniref:E3 ubiquitin-protein ligase listerin n=1 Tax=Anaeramoeba flamelloides TaxID=1746091 RepID=A0AAV7Y9F7_9EUKA|nr:e3 ubiquitin-protein ligase listerin [Anaeramoeba flamelloides]